MTENKMSLEEEIEVRAKHCPSHGVTYYELGELLRTLYKEDYQTQFGTLAKLLERHAQAMFAEGYNHAMDKMKLISFETMYTTEAPLSFIEKWRKENET